jgi:hypothetical protein
MIVLSETRERFLRAIAAQVSPERITEIHFFAPIKQSGVESGVAVVVEAAPSELPSDVSSDLTSDAADDAPRDPSRIVVYTARYRLTLKGPDRGKWETSVVAEADAPMVTVEAVVRGVERRAGDAEDATRIEGDDLRAVLAHIAA